MNARRITAAFAVSQLIAWGPFYYSLPVFVTPIAADRGWGQELILWSLSAALLSAVVAAPLVGSAIDSGRGRHVLIAGHALGALCLALLSQAQSATLFFVLCCCLGASQAACLYDAAFSLIHRHLKTDAGRAIIHVTLVAGLSGTIFVPLTQLLVEAFGWRSAMALLGAISLVPIGAYLLSVPSETAHSAQAPTVSAPAWSKVPWSTGLALLIAAFGLSTAAFSVVAIGFLPLMAERGLDGMTAAQIFAVVGPSQIAGRLLVWIRSRQFQPFRHGPMVFALLPLAVLVLIAAGTHVPLLIVFGMLFGMNSGLATIVRGTAPAEMCATHVIGRVNGVIGAVSGVARAAAPALFAWALVRLGANWALAGLLACAMFALASFAAAARFHLRANAATAGQERTAC